VVVVSGAAGAVGSICGTNRSKRLYVIGTAVGI